MFENNCPPPHGPRYAGRAAVRAIREAFLRAGREPRFEITQIFALGDWCVMHWTYHWRDAGGRLRHVRGVDLHSLCGGQFAQKLSYVKG